jgi:uroporphyrinogen decarboxylase
VNVQNSGIAVVETLDGQKQAIPPVWLMRQAGRYLPEYRAIRERTGSFLDLCSTPELAAELTLQPVRRFGLDAAIVFSDIMMVPMALGQRVTFEADEGPRVDPLIDATSIAALRADIDEAVFAPVYDTIRLVKAALPAGVALIGFCGAPWTLATYMVAGKRTSDHVPVRCFAYAEPSAFTRVIGILNTVSVEYLCGQLAAGADAVQIFDSWAGVLPPDQFAQWCIQPVATIAAQVRSRLPQAKIIAFPRGIGTLLRRYVEWIEPDGIGLDWMIDKNFARDCVPAAMAIQGNLDPVALLAGGAALDRAVDEVLEAFADRPFIFNLGHGVLPQTPIAHVERMLRRVRDR